MKRIRPVASLALVAMLAAWAFAGCENAADTDAANDLSSREQTINLDDPYGGYNTADESPAFDDAELASVFGPSADVAVNDDVDTTRVDRRRPHRFLMITWGNLCGDSLITFPTDWSGSLCAENGVVLVRRTILFDARDYLLPRTSRACVEWVSHTQPHFDGVIVSLFKTRCDSLLASTAAVDSLCDEPLSVTFKTGPLTVTFTQDELANLPKVIPVDDAGNAVAFNTLTVMPSPCPQGFLAGQWRNVEGERYAGVFRGKWVSENGAHMGYLRGVYGENGVGRHVFFGKWITENGRFKGLLKGTYGAFPPTRDAMADGWFEGVWFSRELRAMGGLKGVWGTRDDTDAGGYFRGVWAARCPRVSA
jgi:hypothetical protein